MRRAFAGLLYRVESDRDAARRWSRLRRESPWPGERRSKGPARRRRGPDPELEDGDPATEGSDRTIPQRRLHQTMDLWRLYAERPLFREYWRAAGLDLEALLRELEALRDEHEPTVAWAERLRAADRQLLMELQPPRQRLRQHFVHTTTLYQWTRRLLALLEQEVHGQEAQLPALGPRFPEPGMLRWWSLEQVERCWHRFSSDPQETADQLKEDRRWAPVLDEAVELLVRRWDGRRPPPDDGDPEREYRVQWLERALARAWSSSSRPPDAQEDLAAEADDRRRRSLVAALDRAVVWRLPNRHAELHLLEDPEVDDELRRSYEAQLTFLARAAFRAQRYEGLHRGPWHASEALAEGRAREQLTWPDLDGARPFVPDARPAPVKVARGRLREDGAWQRQSAAAAKQAARLLTEGL
jgi:hypothetical protein